MLERSHVATEDFRRHTLGSVLHAARPKSRKTVCGRWLDARAPTERPWTRACDSCVRLVQALKGLPVLPPTVTRLPAARGRLEMEPHHLGAKQRPNTAYWRRAR